MTRKTFTTSDNATLSYIDQGQGQPLVLLHGGAQAAEQFKYQLAEFSDRYRVIAIDMRGHGHSPAPGYGYRISRYAKDLDELLQALNLDQVWILGHSLGCSVIWNYMDLFGAARFTKLILVDEPTFCIANPAWSEQQVAETGAMFTMETLYSTLNAIEGASSEQTIRGFVDALTTDAMQADDKKMIVGHMLTLPKEAIATLYFNNITQDWRDIIRRIEVPTLVIGGEQSGVNWQSQRWIHQQIKGSQFELLAGNHFMFIENSRDFNICLSNFLKKVP